MNKSGNSVPLDTQLGHPPGMDHVAGSHQKADFLIDRQHPERVFLVYKDKIGTKVDSKSYRENWKPLRKQIGLTIGDLFFFSDKSLIFEVPTQKKLGILSKFRSDKDEE